MKQLIFILSVFFSINSFAQCSGGNTTGTHNDCFLNTSQQANINRLNVDSILSGAKYYGQYFGSVIAEAYGGTGYSTLAAALAASGTLTSEVDGSITNEIELPTQTGNNGKILTTDGSTPSWITHTNETITLSGDATGSGIASVAVTLASSGIAAGTYGIVTVDTKGRATAGKRQETYSGTTDGSGNYTVTFGTAYSVAPNIQAQLINGTDTQTSRVTSITTTGFTVLIRNRTDVVGLLPSFSNVSGATVDVLITEK